MKRIHLTLSIITVILLSSCAHMLDKGPLDKYSENAVWNDIDMAQGFALTTLSSVTSNLIWNDMWSDNCIIQEDGNASNFNREQIDRYYDAGWNIYATIRRCNKIIHEMNQPSAIIDKEKDYLTAQAKAMRALIYFSRARLFGKLMIVDKLIDPQDDMKLPRTKTIKDTYDFIIKDLQEAAEGLPTELTAQQGMLTKGAAYAYLAEVALHGAAYIENGQEEYYKIAKKASEDLFQLNKYELDSDYKAMFNDYGHSLNSKEIILAQWKHGDNTTFQGTWMQSLVPNVDNSKIKDNVSPKFIEEYAGWPTMFPSVDLVNEYRVIDEDGQAKKWNQTSYYNSFKANGGTVEDAIYKNRDHRFYASIVYDNTPYFLNTVTTRVNGNVHWDSNIHGSWGMSKSGYLFRKCVYENKRLLNNQPTYYHYVTMRLGRAYLNYAEVMLRLGKTDIAIDYINKTREQHGGLPALETNLSKTAAWGEYKSERRIELLFEGDRYWSLLRWAKADGKDTVDELNKVHQAINIAEDGKSFEIVPIPYVGGDNERIFSKKRFLLPVPHAQIQENSLLDQNPIW